MKLDTEFLDRLASDEPAPGGGGASAYAGALAAALASMVGNLAVGKPLYADAQEGILASLDQLSKLRAQLLDLVQADAEAYLPLNRAYRMPRATQEQADARQAAIQEALGPACDIPLEIMDACSAIIDEADYLAHHGSRLAVSDAGAAAVLARGALVSAAMNIFLNVESMTDSDRVLRYRSRVNELMISAQLRSDIVASQVMGVLR
ncbi:MAG: cyclodeaminase/cyclohydrolase family protein [Eggerthellaceae bacterium]|nr:cyclodeaminase/cyclohydrolase family protein [Eggerthellaceae bacterium]